MRAITTAALIATLTVCSCDFGIELGDFELTDSTPSCDGGWFSTRVDGQRGNYTFDADNGCFTGCSVNSSFAPGTEARIYVRPGESIGDVESTDQEIFAIEEMELVPSHTVCPSALRVSITAIRPGDARLIVSNESGTEMDQVVISVRDPASMSMLAPITEETGVVQLKPGEDRLIGATLLDEDSNHVCTSAPWTWFVDAESVVSVENSCGVAAVSGLSEGSSHINVEVHGFNESVPVVVQEASE